MELNRSDIPAIILERIEHAHPALALFSATEIDDWPSGSLDHLRECGILRPADRAEATICPGCSWQCHKPVVIRSAREGLGKHAFIVCDEEPNHGRQAVSLRSLEQYRATIDTVASFIVRQMQFRPSRSSPHGSAIFLGIIRGRHGTRRVSIDLCAGELQMKIGQELERVARILCWITARLSIDLNHIKRLANRK